MATFQSFGGGKPLDQSQNMCFINSHTPLLASSQNSFPSVADLKKGVGATIAKNRLGSKKISSTNSGSNRVVPVGKSSSPGQIPSTRKNLDHSTVEIESFDQLQTSDELQLVWHGVPAVQIMHNSMPISLSWCEEHNHHLNWAWEQIKCFNFTIKGHNWV